MTAITDQPIDFYCAFCLTRKQHTDDQHRRSVREREAFMAGICWLSRCG